MPPRKPPAARTTPTLIKGEIKRSEMYILSGCAAFMQISGPTPHGLFPGCKVPPLSDSPIAQRLRGSLEEIGWTIDDSLKAPSSPVSSHFLDPVLPWGMPVGYQMARPLFLEPFPLLPGRSSLLRLFLSVSLRIPHLFSHHLTCLGVKLHQQDIDACHILTIVVLASLACHQAFHSLQLDLIPRRSL